MKIRIISIFLLSILISQLIIGCSKEKIDIKPSDLSTDIVASFITDLGYEIVDNKGKTTEYLLKKEMLLYAPYQKQWGVQALSPDDYIDKNIEIYQLIVKNHLLDSLENNNKKQTVIYVMVADNEVIGGYSLPDYDILHVGGVFSLMGLTLEEVTGGSFKDFQEQWRDKYNN